MLFTVVSKGPVQRFLMVTHSDKGDWQKLYVNAELCKTETSQWCSSYVLSTKGNYSAKVAAENSFGLGSYSKRVYFYVVSGSGKNELLAKTNISNLFAENEVAEGCSPEVSVILLSLSLCVNMLELKCT